MFKIGNSKQLPPIPDHLSEVGKDFIRRCLQRDPSQRPTALKLLQHPFARNVVPVVKSILSSEFIDQHTDVSIGRSFRGVGHAGKFSPLHTGQMIHQLKGARTALMISGTHPTGIMSCPVSPVRSPLLNPGSLYHSNRKKSASPISSPITISGSSTPLTGGNGFTPFNQLKPLGFLHECYSNKPRPNHPLRPTPKLDLYHGGQKGSTVSREQGTSESEICAHQLGSATHVNLSEPNDKQSMWVDNVSHQLLREHAPLKPSLDLSCSSPMLAHTCGT